MLIAACPGAGMKGKQVAKRGQQKPGQPLAQARERLWPRARSGPGQEYSGRLRDGRTDSQGRGTETQRWGYMRREIETLRW